MRLYIILAVVVGLFMTGCSTRTENIVSSPNNAIQVVFNLNANGEVFYAVSYKNREIVAASTLGFDFKDQKSLQKNLEIVNVKHDTYTGTWEMPWGEKHEVVEIYNSIRLTFKEKEEPNRTFELICKAFDDGIGFRYVFPEQENFYEVFITEEKTQFNLNEDYKTFWIPGDWDIYEHLYKTTKLSNIDATQYRNHESLAQTSIPNNAVNTPVTMVSESGLHLSFHEANLTDYAGMTLKVDTANLSLESCLVGSDNRDYKVYRKLPFETPWRTIQISENAAGLIESDLIVNLNDPNKLGDVSWFTPTKYVGIWWDMHLGRKSWDKASGKHGATTAYAKELIDFASEHAIGGLLVEGWNTGWEHWIGFEDREGVFDFVTPYDDYDLTEVVRYGKEKGVELIMHHETSAATQTYDQQMDSAYRLMQSLGINSVKTGYVGKILPKGEYHHGQYMVNHYRRALETAAKYQVAINAHEPIKATGIRRTYPNAISREGLRGQEFNAWASDGGNPPEHLPIVAFTRMLAGPIDFTPGIFNIKLEPYKKENQVNTTLAHQLALYVVINSPIQMAADLIDYYKDHPAFQFIEDVPVNWEQTKVLNGEVGDFVTIARKDRASDNWFVGAITDENEREIELDFSFLDADKKYQAIIYKDAADSHWDKNPTNYTIEKQTITSVAKKTIKLAAGGGFAISLVLE